MHVEQSVKSVRSAKCMYYFEDLSAVSNHTEHKDMVVSQDDHDFATTL